MIHYLDTSALVKRYIPEAGSEPVNRQLRRGGVATSRTTYAEVAASVARMCRDRRLSTTERDEIFARLDPDFAELTIVESRVAVMRRVPGLVSRRAVRGFDAVQLCSALTLRDRGNPVTFWAADRALVEAAEAEGLRTTLL